MIWLCAWLGLLPIQDEPKVATGPSTPDRVLRVGERVTGELQPSTAPERSSEQRFRLEIAELGTITISLESCDFDARLRIEDEAGQLLAEDDDSGIETNARVTIEAVPGRVLIAIATGRALGSGAFELAASKGTEPDLQGAELMDARIRFLEKAARRATTRGAFRVAARHRVEEGELRQVRSDYQAAEAAHQEGLRLSRLASDEALEARARMGLGLACQALGEHSSAREHLEASLALREKQGDRLGTARALGALGILHRDLEEYDRSLELCSRRLRIAEEMEDLPGRAAAHGMLGILYHAVGDLGRSIEHQRKSIGLYREVGDEAGEAGALVNLASALSQSGHGSEAEEALRRALPVFRNRGDRRGEMIALIELGHLDQSRGAFQSAREYLTQALSIARDLGSPSILPTILSALGLAHMGLAEYSESRDRLEESLKVARELESPSAQAVAIGNLGHLYWQLGDYDKAAECYRTLLEIAQELGDRIKEAAAWASLGNCSLAIGRFTDAKEHFVKALHAEQRAGLSSMKTNLSIASVQYRLGQFDDAKKNLESLLVEARNAQSLTTEARVISLLGLIHLSRSELAQAERRLQESLEIKKRLADRSGAAGDLINLGIIDRTLGDYARAESRLEEGLSLTRSIGHRRYEANALGALGLLRFDLGDEHEAERYFLESLQVKRSIGDVAAQARTLANLGNLYFELGQFEKAKSALKEAMTTAVEASAEEGALRLSLAQVFRATGELSRAREELLLVLEVAKRQGQPQLEAAALRTLADDLLGEDLPRARRMAEDADRLAEGLSQDSLRIRTLTTKARSALAGGDSRAALSALEEAEARLARMASQSGQSLEAGGLRARYSGLSAAAQEVTWLQLDQATDDPKARAQVLRRGFEAAGRWKGRTLLEGIAEHRAGLRSREALDLRRQRREALARHQALLTRVSRAIHDDRPSVEIERLRVEARDALVRADTFADRLREVSPRDAALDLPLGTGPEELRAAVLGPDDVLVDFVEGEERLYAYVVTDELFEMIDVGRRVDLLAELEPFLRGIRDPERLAGPSEIARLGRALFERLIAPALALGKVGSDSIGRLIVVPSATLAALPFEALVAESPDRAESFDEVTFVLDRFEVCYGPSSPVLVEMAQVGPRAEPGPVLVLADPDYGVGAGQKDPPGANAIQRLPVSLARLEGTRREALAIADLLGTDELEGLDRHGSWTQERIELHLGKHASRKVLSKDLREYAIVHLACHGIVDAERPQRSGLILSTSTEEPGWFTVRDALEIDLDCDLVVLSACDTASGRPEAGQGIESLARAFLYAGARSVVASLWQVSDWSAAETMRRFYRGALSESGSSSGALRQAKLDIRRGRVKPGLLRDPKRVTEIRIPTAAHPFFWAPFIHIGLGPR